MQRMIVTNQMNRQRLVLILQLAVIQDPENTIDSITQDNEAQRYPCR